MPGSVSGDRCEQPASTRVPRRCLALHRAAQGQSARVEARGLRGRSARLEGERRMCVV